MAITSKSGLWRLPAFKMRVEQPEYPWVTVKEGRFLCADHASLIQFRPGWEAMVKMEVEKCRGLFVDVGANIGYYSIMAAKNGCSVIALEPDLHAYTCLLSNVSANKMFGKVVSFNWAGWSKREVLKLEKGRHTDVSKVAEIGGKVPAAEVMGVPIDELLHGEIPELVKIDAEGSEAEILKGMPDTLAAHPKLVFEAWDMAHLKACYPYLHDYRIKRLDRTNYLAT